MSTVALLHSTDEDEVGPIEHLNLYVNDRLIAFAGHYGDRQKLRQLAGLIAEALEVRIIRGRLK